MIPYVELINQYSLKVVSLVEPQECWFELTYQDYGEFEIYCRATEENLNSIKMGRYVKIPHKSFVWVITSIQYTFTSGGAKMISAKGYEAKWLLYKRCIQKPKELQGTITKALYGLVNENLGASAGDIRAIEGFNVDSNDIHIDISGTQATRGNLLEFVDNILKTYNCGSQVIYENEKLVYKIFVGEIKTQSIRFSQSLDNLLSSEFLMDDSEVATNALVVSTFEETKTVDEVEYKYKVDYTKVVDKGKKGVERAEIIVESNLSTKYEDVNGEEKETSPDSALYQGWQTQEGNNKLAELVSIEKANGEIDLTNSMYTFDEDFFIGDMIRVQDEYFNFYIDTRIAKYTIKQDANGYGEEAEYGGLRNE